MTARSGVMAGAVAGLAAGLALLPKQNLSGLAAAASLAGFLALLFKSFTLGEGAKLGLLASRHRIEAGTERRAAARLYLAHDEETAACKHEVELTERTAPVAREHLESP